MKPTIVLFGDDFRLCDNRALIWAAQRGPVIPIYILDDTNLNPFPPGGAARWWLQESIKDLSASILKRGASLILRRGDRYNVLQDIINTTGAITVTWNRRYEPFLKKQDETLAAALSSNNIDIKIHDGFLLFDPTLIHTQSGTPYKVFTPFSRACLSTQAPPPPLPAPLKITGPSNLISDPLESWKLVPTTAQWPKILATHWHIGEIAAQKQLKKFTDDILSSYNIKRDRPDHDGTSRLSPYLHFGQISPQHIWHTIHKAALSTSISNASIERYLLEILWREFSWHLLSHFPDLTHKPLLDSFINFPWRRDETGVNAWKTGQTGYPLVDAGMRQLWQTGWMHNRVRMITASFLVKHLLIDWRVGASWFWDTLVDADLGNNTGGWQWVAGCGADSAPYYRIFNPVIQGNKFDPDGTYVRRYVPELAKLNTRWIHEPWKAPLNELEKANIVLGKTYPIPIIAHDKARERALLAFSHLKSTEVKPVFPRKT